MTCLSDQITEKFQYAKRTSGEMEKSVIHAIDKVERFEAFVKANAARHGATPKEIETFINGDEDFVSWIKIKIEEEYGFVKEHYKTNKGIENFIRFHCKLYNLTDEETEKMVCGEKDFVVWLSAIVSKQVKDDLKKETQRRLQK